MNQRTTPWAFTGITLGLFITAIGLPAIFFPYAETTEDPDAIQFVVWFIAIGFLLLAFAFVPITIAVWIFKRNQNKEG